MYQIIAIFAAFFIGACSSLLYIELRGLKKRIETLEKASRQRLPFKSQDEILDAIAAIDTYLDQKSFKDELIENAKGHLINSMAVGTKREK